MGAGEFGHDPSVLSRLAGEVRGVHAHGIEQCLVIGGGNIVRGDTVAASQGIERANADYMGMLATVINALAVQSVLERLGLQTRVLSAIPMAAVCEPYIRRRAIRHMEKGTGGDLRRRHRQPLLHDRHRRRAACGGAGLRRAAQGHQGRRRLLGRPGQGRERGPLRPADVS